MGVAYSRQPEVERRRVLSVSELTSLVKDSLRAAFSSVWVAGEISNLSQPQSGHIYLTLKDSGAQLRAVVWRSAASRLKFQLQDGLEVLCHGEIDVYAPHGSYQLIVREIEPRGEGALQLALKQLRARLAAEGLFDVTHKKPLPAFPRRIALVTSPTGAAIRDFLEVAGRRWRGPEILIVPTSVQGAEAAPQIVAAIATVGRLRDPPDVLVLARGGGSLEDLWCFNEEMLVRAIFRCPIPVVSAVGHEIDVTLADLVADVRALTPSEAAERVVPSAEEVRVGLRHVAQRMTAALRGRVEHARSRWAALAERPVLRRPHERLHDLARKLDELELRAKRAAWNCLKQVRNQLSASAGRLESLSPLAVLGRGYSVTMRVRDHGIVRDSADVSLGEQLDTRLARGRVISRVEQTDVTIRPTDRTPKGDFEGSGTP
jgi:exodeoxyribonuclease VII large subunit